MASSEDDVLDSPVGLEDDLFGSDDEAPEQVRELSDRELDSGDDENRDDRATKPEVEAEHEERTANIMDSTIWRHPLPKPADGEFNTLRLPAFLGIEPRPYNPDTFKPPTKDHHSDTKSNAFSASAIAASTIRHRNNPISGELESNAVIYKWSDGSSTIAVGDQHYELQGKPLAPPRNEKVYQEVQDSHSYIASPSIASQLLVLVGHMTNQFTVRPNKDIVDDALEKLQMNLAAATRRGKKGDEKAGPELITNTIDPELQKKRAEMAEKERLKAQRRRENAAEKAINPRAHAGPRGGLSVDDLEGRGGRRAAGGNTQRKRPQRRAEYDSDDEPRGGRGHREDEYDKEDDFLASSDEEEEVEGAEDDEDDDMVEDDESDRGPPKAKKQKTSRQEEVNDPDADAEADLDDVEAPVPAVATGPSGRGRNRNVIEDDDDE